MKRKLIAGMAVAGLLLPFISSAQRKPDVQAHLIRGPYLQVASSTSIVIRWRTDALQRSVVNYSPDEKELKGLAEDPALTFEHKVTITGLSPRTKYYYAIGGGPGDTLQKGSDNYFVTLPPPGAEGSYRIGVFGDCGNNSVNQRSVRDQVIKYLADKPMDAWILLGDNAYTSGQDPEFQEKFFNIYKDNLLKKYPLFPAPGNHDYNDFYQYKATAQATHDIAYYQNFSMPTKGECGGVASGTQAFYSFDIGNVHFLSIDSYGKEDKETRLYDTLGAQVQWIKKDLEAFHNTKRGWVVAYWHHPPYTMGSHNSDHETELVKIRENFIRILERYGVDLIVCGHSHLYERSRLMNGHYGMEATFNAAEHNLSSSTALYDGSENSCPYIKDSANKGTVYVVTGSAGAMGSRQATYPHDAMYYSYNELGGASMIEVNENRLELKWICSDGQIRDHFVMMKDVNRDQVITIKKGQAATLTASFIGTYKWNKGKDATRSIIVKPTAAKTVYEVVDPYTCLKDRFEVRVSK
ncbi:metallophosphoesterase [Niastella yeongjuensis]|uniref:Metallophosphoesterase n=1 Tax=Niastella yeongjuensis TaxID=354355 RepID=A0A1V9EJL2_9BACT|nr:metallophosphoesterase family protein [Niastella yeongjuensis]OQP46251.1 metallophosphoesterase [Niastella yeongjuensis]SEP46181.1 3',5'-cyclic AMP phosphodiesterase CpdA [Niastella yeongjuensis]